jgi:tRNA pseudouridine13 synthase
MYVHAYQSHIWNVVASARIKLNSTQPLEGDLILTTASMPSKLVDPDDPDGSIDFQSTEEEDEEPTGSVRALTAEDIESGKFTIGDIVLPTPGYAITYPEHPELRKAYAESMAQDGLDPFDMRRAVREVSLSGHYRPVVHRPEDVRWEIFHYTGRDTLLDTEQVSTEGEFMAIRVQLKLGTSQYATMALREICKRDSVDIQYWGKERDELEKARKVTS